MMNYIVFAVFLLGSLLRSTTSHRLPFYRTDYTYIENFDAFYKIHILHGRDITRSAWNTAFYTCADEGASLFYPKAEGEWAIVKNLTIAMTEDSNITEIFVGFHDEYKLGEFISVDGQTMPDPILNSGNAFSLFYNNFITMNIDTGLLKLDRIFIGNDLRTSNKPFTFVCKKVDGKSCPTIDRSYKYKKASKKCYKIHKKLQLWQEAMKTCFVEGGILAVIENEPEAKEVQDMLEVGELYFVGVRKMTDNGYNHIYYTVKGKKFSTMYQNENQPLLWDYGTVVNRESQLFTQTAPKSDMLPFICEMEVPV